MTAELNSEQEQIIREQLASDLMGTNGQPKFSSSDATPNRRVIADGALIQQALKAGALPKP